ncbi:MAG: SIS domain-containing protein [Armatimonadetes bacterium]|nr:SIS domain-containing protein [Armatimonadota bacterium]
MAFLNEVKEKSKVLRDLTAFYQRDEGRSLLEKLWAMASRRPRSFIFTGMGTSEFVSQVLVEYLSRKSPVPFIFWEAGELLHYGIESIRDDDVVIAVSQSGESIETRRITEHLSYHLRLVAVTNNPESYMARYSRVNLPMLAGKEASISNKTYSNSMALMLLIGRALIGEDYDEVFADLEQVANEMDRFLAERQNEIAQAAGLLRDATFVYFISRGPSLAAARQAGLTYQEGVRIFTSVLPGGSFRHGPFEIVGQGHYAIMFASDGHGGDLVRNMALEMAELGSKVVLFTSKNAGEHKNLLNIVLMPAAPELFPLACALPQELLLYHMAADRGWEAGVFQRGSKVTLRE